MSFAPRAMNLQISQPNIGKPVDGHGIYAGIESSKFNYLVLRGLQQAYTQMITRLLTASILEGALHTHHRQVPNWRSLQS
jgi:hypothetical protein